jgi:hypothetical protein
MPVNRRPIKSLPSPEEICAVFRDEDGVVYWKEPGPNRPLNRPAGSVRSRGYWRISYKNEHYQRHYIVWCLHHKRWPKPGYELDHIDRVPGNDCISNLREVTRRENMYNTGARGYHWDEKNKKWRAYIMVDYKSINLGRYKSKEEAQEAYNRAKLLYHQIGKTQGTSPDPNQAQENPSR